jgi:hypothetical protein
VLRDSSTGRFISDKSFGERNALISCACGCGEQMTRYHKGRERRYKHRHSPKAEQHYHWKGGVRISIGYIYLWKPDHHFADVDGYVREHRLVYEEYHKCCLLRWAIIHHINEDTKDNRIENLQVVSNREHPGIHNKTRQNRLNHYDRRELCYRHLRHD